MKFPQKQTLKQIAKIINSDYVGIDDFPILGMNEIHVVEAGDIVFVDHPKYYDKALESNATIILINKKVECPEGKALLVSDDPFRDFNKLTKHFNPFKPSDEAISKKAIIGKNTIIQPNVFIGNEVTIGHDCIIHANVTIYDGCIIGNNVTIHSGTVLGADAFYYKNRPTGFDKLISGGNVILKDKVDLGSNCTIDRGVTGSTTIGKGTKIDNMVHVGHDTIIGEKCLIASQVGIAGCVIIENEVTLWGQVGVRSDIRIGEKAVVLGQTGVTKSIEGGKVYSGNPIQDARQRLKEIAYMRNQMNSKK
ncbi:UDP-3-O-(3-hydroxymyristoyl)glucosamine N-acyltransferase [Urechidicola croceus]|uniref:UDP-3-O-(3-hydroxymyristoyl)glucosamine N-acyltransferase n=1 Tax=Urechidicola croceus TaxID=1850246 RepID=A0A1D8P510_9FLAO|nr:UDP-3-O-(3-hydroxymyristoyl)glucosamine N-acyltransferase [Urechidicola croceus]AOW19646.1 UDP-3-O-(3-hydroxymyristoyl)glucosamine N-acyltransferase [Urechidicola croceus]